MRTLVLTLRSLQVYFWATVLLFLFSAFYGYQSQTFHSFLAQQFEGLMEVAEEINRLENANVVLFLFIFFNNALKSIFVLYAGLMLGILPVLFVAVNGMLIGYLIYLLNQNEMTTSFSTLEVILRGLLPHGIIELPVVLVAAAYGLKLGAAVWKKLVLSISGSRDDKVDLGDLLKKTGPLVLFITIALLVAALIETFVTPLFLRT